MPQIKQSVNNLQCYICCNDRKDLYKNTENLYEICDNNHGAAIHLSCFSGILDADSYKCPICRKMF